MGGMRSTIIALAGLAACASISVAAAQEAQPAPAVEQTAQEDAVGTYHAMQMYYTYTASAEMLENPAYDNDVVAGAEKLLEIAEQMPVEALPESYQAYLREKNARQRKSIDQIRGIFAGRTEEELTLQDLGALKEILAEVEQETAAIAEKYPEAEAALGDAACQAFAAKLAQELQLEEKAKMYLLEHPEVAAGGQEDALAASMRYTAGLIREYLEAKGVEFKK